MKNITEAVFPIRPSALHALGLRTVQATHVKSEKLISIIFTRTGYEVLFRMIMIFREEGLVFTFDWFQVVYIFCYYRAICVSTFRYNCIYCVHTHTRILTVRRSELRARLFTYLNKWTHISPWTWDSSPGAF